MDGRGSSDMLGVLAGLGDAVLAAAGDDVGVVDGVWPFLSVSCTRGASNEKKTAHQSPNKRFETYPELSLNPKVPKACIIPACEHPCQNDKKTHHTWLLS